MKIDVDKALLRGVNADILSLRFISLKRGILLVGNKNFGLQFLESFSAQGLTTRYGIRLLT
jgi:hypothetical protein